MQKVRIVILTLSLFLIIPRGFTQSDFSFITRATSQIDFQREEIMVGPRTTQKSTSLNYGISALAIYSLNKKIELGVGAGYLRNRFEIKRPYNHQLLNLGRDSLPVETKTINYDYHLLTLPIVARFKVKNKSNSANVNIEYIPAFKFSTVYNGAKPFENANNRENKFDFFSHSLTISLGFPIISFKSKTLFIEPFCRVLQNYHKNEYLFEIKNETNIRYFDAVGVNISYRL